MGVPVILPSLFSLVASLATSAPIPLPTPLQPIAIDPPLAFPTSDAELDADGVDQIAFLNDAGCQPLTISRRERDALEAAFDRMHDALADERVIDLIGTKTDWVIERDHRWVRGPNAGHDFLHAWRAASEAAPGARARTVMATLVAYDRGPGRDCPGPLGSDAMHAFTRTGSKVVAMRKPFLDHAVASLDRESSRRTLARVLAHELIHVLGHTHQDEPEAVLGAAYANTVPVYIACLVEAWPDLDAIGSQCGRAVDVSFTDEGDDKPAVAVQP